MEDDENLTNKKEQDLCEVQALRSASEWSMGLNPSHTECSVYNAYLDLIENSKHFIYIEN